MKIQGRLHKLAMRLGNNPRLALMKMIQGGLLFAFGVLMIMVSNQVLNDSISQELIALIGLIIAGAGVLWTAVGYLSMSVLRLYNMINKKD
jgi:multisubunit Na+/H+ antiporter MnhB subunit